MVQWTCCECAAFQSASVQEAISEITSRDASSQRGKTEPRQPLLFRTQGQYFVLGDRTPIPVTDASCFTEAVEFLVFTFFVFNVQYPQELRYFYCFLEGILNLPPSLPNSSVLGDFRRKLQPYFPQEGSE